MHLIVVDTQRFVKMPLFSFIVVVFVVIFIIFFFVVMLSLFLFPFWLVCIYVEL